MGELERVPEELLIHILLYACKDPADLIKFSHISTYFQKVVDSPIMWNQFYSNFTLPNNLEGIIINNKTQYIEARKYFFKKHAKMADEKQRKKVIKKLDYILVRNFPYILLGLLQYLFLILFLVLLQTNLYIGLPEWVIPLEDISIAIHYLFFSFQIVLFILFGLVLFILIQNYFSHATQQIALWIVLFVIFYYLSFVKYHLIYYFTNHSLYSPLQWWIVLLPFFLLNCIVFGLVLSHETMQNHIIWKPFSFHFDSFKQVIPLLFNLFSIPFFIIVTVFLSTNGAIPKWTLLVPLFGMEVCVGLALYDYFKIPNRKEFEMIILLIGVLCSVIWLQMRIYFEQSSSLTFVPLFFFVEVFVVRAIVA